MIEHINTIIVGGGQAGLCTSYYLKKQGRDHIILEKAHQAAQVWRNRWDSFTLVTPNWMIRLPGAPYTGQDPNGFMPRDEIVRYIENYIQHYTFPIRYGVRVKAVSYLDESFLIETTQGNIKASNVVIAAGLFQKPKIPSFSAAISTKINQIHSSQYKNPESLPPGAVLVVGSSQSGSQIAEELNENERSVYLSVSATGRIPRRYRSKDVYIWMKKMGYFIHKVNELQSPHDKFAPSAHSTGKNGGHTINLHQFAKDGITLIGRIQDANGNQIILRPDLKDNLAFADKFEDDFTKEIDEYIRSEHLDVPTESLPQLKFGYEVDEIRELDLHEANITTIIWATGYSFDYSWIKLPVVDEDGYPIQDCGVSNYPGLYFVGMTFLCNGISGLLAGVGDDARRIAEMIQKRSN